MNLYKTTNLEISTAINIDLQGDTKIANISKNIILDNKTNEDELIFDNISISFKKAKSFLNKAINGELIEEKNYTLSNNPLINAVIPVFNGEKSISRVIKSIQNQNIDNIEIVIVNDCSKDKTLSILQKIQKKDPRIIILNNTKNMGTLYSRSIGTLSAKGKYIFPLDCDDLFLDYNIFETIYNIAEKGNFDIVEFKAIFCIYSSKNILERKIKENYFSSHKLNLVLFQPELGDYFLKKGNQLGIYSIIDVYLWAKCIKTKIYQKALNLLGEQKYSRFMTLNEDLVGITILFNIAESFKFVGKYGILHVSTPGSVSWKGPGKKKNEFI